MKIGFDAKRAAQNRTGLGNYSRFVVRTLSEQMPQNDYHLYAPRKSRTPYIGEIPTLGDLGLHFPERAAWRLLPSLWRSRGILADLRRDGIELYHGLSNELPFGISGTGCRSVVTIHDLIFVHCPEYYHPIDRLIYNYKFGRACREADRVVAVSEFTKREVMRYYGVAEEHLRYADKDCIVIPYHVDCRRCSGACPDGAYRGVGYGGRFCGPAYLLYFYRRLFLYIPAAYNMEGLALM